MLKWVGSKLRRRKPADGRVAEAVTTAVAETSSAASRSRTAQVVPALLLATGTGVAFWWWTQWARGAEESEAAGKREQDGPSG